VGEWAKESSSPQALNGPFPLFSRLLPPKEKRTKKLGKKIEMNRLRVQREAGDAAAASAVALDESHDVSGWPLHRAAGVLYSYLAAHVPNAALATVAAAAAVAPAEDSDNADADAAVSAPLTPPISTSSSSRSSFSSSEGQKEDTTLSLSVTVPLSKVFSLRTFFFCFFQFVCDAAGKKNFVFFFFVVCLLHFFSFPFLRSFLLPFFPGSAPSSFITCTRT
jgi:hypothetical protein